MIERFSQFAIIRFKMLWLDTLHFILTNAYLLMWFLEIDPKFFIRKYLELGRRAAFNVNPYGIITYIKLQNAEQNATFFAKCYSQYGTANMAFVISV